MKPVTIFTITKGHVLDLFTATRGLDEAERDALKGALDLWFADLPHNAGGYMFRDVVTALRANGDATTAAEIGKIYQIDGAIAAGQAVQQ